MKRLAAALLAVTLATSPALAESHKVLVLLADGKIDAKARTKVNAAVLKLAKTTPNAQVAAGDITYTAAAEAVGCKPDTTTCAEEVINMLGVDEIVSVTVASKSGSIDVTVRRTMKGAASRDAQTTVTVDKAGELDAIAAVFQPPVAPPIKDEPKPPIKEDPPVITPLVKEDPKPKQVAQPDPIVQPDPQPPKDETPPPDRSRLYMAGMGAGVGLFVVGAALWGKAASIQSDIDEAPSNTEAELRHIQDLESSGDGYARVGNVFAIAGLAVGGAFTYFYIRNVRARSRAISNTAIVPYVAPNGIGFAIGGSL